MCQKFVLYGGEGEEFLYGGFKFPIFRESIVNRV